MKKRLFTLLLAVMVVATTVPAYADNGKSKNKKDDNYVLSTFSETSDDAAEIQELEATVGRCFTEENTLTPIEASLDFDFTQAEEVAVTSDLDGEDIAEINAKTIKATKPNGFKLASRYCDSVTFFAKPAKYAQYYCIFVYTDKKNAKLMSPVKGQPKMPMNYAKYFSYSAPAKDGNYFTLTSSNYSGITTGNTLYFTMMSAYCDNGVYSYAMTKPVTVTIPDNPLTGNRVKMEMVKQYLSRYDTKGDWLIGKKNLRTQKFKNLQAKVQITNTTGKNVVLNKTVTNIKSGLFWFNSDINETGAMFFKPNKGSVKSNLTKTTDVICKRSGHPASVPHNFRMNWVYEGGSYYSQWDNLY